MDIDSWKIIDLFSGCGGMSLGFELAGFKAVGASEIDEWAGDTYARNHAGTTLLRGDIRQVENWGDALPEVDKSSVIGVVGGPPCQGFSLSGNRDPSDPRNSLFMDFVKCVRYYRPSFFVMENVPGLLSMKTASGAKVIDVICREFGEAGYEAVYEVLNSANYGVPQIRKRVFIVGFRSDLSLVGRFKFPEPTVPESNFLTVDDAISDLPGLDSGEGSENQPYTRDPHNNFQIWARSGSERVSNHEAMRHTQRIIARFRCIAPGESVADVPSEHSAARRGSPEVKSGKVYSQNNQRVFSTRPSPTIAASFQSNYVHPSRDRNFTAREGARLQSFPDSYVFLGARTTMSWEKKLSQYQQIGNAVPPLMAKALAESLMRHLKSGPDEGGHISSTNAQQSLF